MFNAKQQGESTRKLIRPILSAWTKETRNRRQNKLLHIAPLFDAPDAMSVSELDQTAVDKIVAALDAGSTGEFDGKAPLSRFVTLVPRHSSTPELMVNGGDRELPVNSGPDIFAHLSPQNSGQTSLSAAVIWGPRTQHDAQAQITVPNCVESPYYSVSPNFFPFPDEDYITPPFPTGE